MTFHRFLAADLVTGTIRDEVPLTSVTFGDALNGGHRFSASIAVDAPAATPQNIDASRTLILIERNGQIVGDGIVWNPKVARRGDSRRLEMSGASLWSYLHRRRIREDRTYTDVDHALIVKDLVDWVQGAGDPSYGTSAGDPTGDVRIDTSAVVAVGKTRTKTYRGDERKPVGEAAEQLAGVIDGPDFGIVWRWDTAPDGTDVPVPSLQVWARRGRRLSDTFELGVNVTDYEFLVAGTEQATHVDAIGQGEGTDMKVATAVDPSLHPAYPRLDGIVSHKDASDLSTLVGHAQADLAERSTPPTTVRVTLDPHRVPRFGGWQVGDEAPIVIDDGWGQVDEVRRIVAWEMNLDADGKEELKVDFERIGEA